MHSAFTAGHGSVFAAWKSTPFTASLDPWRPSASPFAALMRTDGARASRSVAAPGSISAGKPIVTGVWLAGRTASAFDAFLTTAGTTWMPDCCCGCGIVGTLTGGTGFTLGNGCGMEELGALGGVGAEGIAGVGGATGSTRPGAAGGVSGFAGNTRVGSAFTRGAGGTTGAEITGAEPVTGWFVAGIAGGLGFFEPNTRPMMPGRLSSAIVGAGVAAAAAGVFGTVDGPTGSRLNSLRRSLASAIGGIGVGLDSIRGPAGGIGTGFDSIRGPAVGRSENVVTGVRRSIGIGGAAGKLGFETTGGEGLGFATGAALTAGSGIAEPSTGGDGGLDVIGFGSGGNAGAETGGVAPNDFEGAGVAPNDFTGAGTGFVTAGIGFAGSGAGVAGAGIGFGFADTGGGTLLSGAAGSISLNVSPVFASFTSVSTLPSGFFVVFTTVTVRSGWPGNFTVIVSPDFALSSGAAFVLAAVIAVPVTIAHAHRFQFHRVMVASPDNPDPRGRP